MGTILAGIFGFIIVFGMFYMLCLYLVEKAVDVGKVKKTTGKMSLPTKKQALIALLAEIVVVIIVLIYAFITKK